MRRILFCICLLTVALVTRAQEKRFCIAKDGKTATIIIDENDWKGVIRAANDLGDDVRKVTGTASPVRIEELKNGEIEDGVGSIIVGTIGKSRIIDKLIKQKKLDVKRIKGRWEAYKRDVVDGNLVIAGSDKRGTIYGIYDLSQRIGVSPWYWMADAPVSHKDEVWYTTYGYDYDWPAVKYRGIFINDEWPSFGTWCQKHFGGVNSKAYEKIFELLLRLKWVSSWVPATTNP